MHIKAWPMHRPEEFWGCVGVVDRVYTVGVDTYKSFRNRAIVVMESWRDLIDATRADKTILSDGKFHYFDDINSAFFSDAACPCVYKGTCADC